MVLFYRQKVEPEEREVSCQRAPPWSASHEESGIGSLPSELCLEAGEWLQ